MKYEDYYRECIASVCFKIKLKDKMRFNIELCFKKKSESKY